MARAEVARMVTAHASATTGAPRRHGIPVLGRPDRLLQRSALLERLRTDPGPVIVVEGPPGSGKSTLLATWASGDPRPCAWLTIEPAHADPVRLVGALASALAEVHPDGPFSTRMTGADAMRGLARVARAVGELEEPTLVVLDDIHRLTDPRALDLVVTLVDRFPASGRLALVTRAGVGLPLTRWQLAGRVLVIDRSDLELDLAECADLLQRLGVPNADVLAPEVHRHTEGWVAGTHLFGLGQRKRRVRDDAVPGSSPGDLAEAYIRSELLDQLHPESVDVLVRTSLVEVVTGAVATALCDAPDAATRLTGVADQGLLVMPIDGTRTSFRVHTLLRDVLLRELAFDPATDLEVRLRTAAWYESAGMIDEAIEQALGAGDLDRAARLVLEVAQARFRDGHAASLTRWIDAFDEQAVRSRPGLMALAAYLHALEGDAPAAALWAGRLEEGPLHRDADGGGPGVDLVVAMLCARGPDRMLLDADRALGSHDEGWRWRTSALFAAGMAELMLDRPDAAATRFQELERIQGAGTAMVRLTARGERAIAELDQRRWAAAQAILDLDRGAVLADPESGRIAAMSWLVADARLAIHRGDMGATLERLQRIQLGRVRLSWAMPWLAVRTLTELARVQLLVGDHQGARVSLSQARDTVAVRPDLGRLIVELELVSQQALAAPRGDDSWSTLTRAELRLLPYLQTYLTIKEIGERLGVSPNTAKTQALSIYGKLGASTRSEAIEAAVARGLLEDLFTGRS
jgi:LuxR family maltose regulon positive regulatory protein